ncbi:hypothetical protein [Streptomyces sp. NPDC000229]|uniref:hypothetical protein n=1 Tax=Streptomyces sp. NPDC000229 TaxID=3154247 RepID=UPI00333160FF
MYDDDYCAAHGLLARSPTSEPGSLGRFDEKEVTGRTRCTRVVDPHTLTEDAGEGDRPATSSPVRHSPPPAPPEYPPCPGSP